MEQTGIRNRRLPAAVLAASLVLLALASPAQAATGTATDEGTGSMIERLRVQESALLKGTSDTAETGLTAVERLRVQESALLKGTSDTAETGLTAIERLRVQESALLKDTSRAGRDQALTEVGSTGFRWSQAVAIALIAAASAGAVALLVRRAGMARHHI